MKNSKVMNIFVFILIFVFIFCLVDLIINSFIINLI